MAKNGNRSILVISDLQDNHIPYVQNHLRDQMIIVDTSLKQKNILSIEQNKNSTKIHYKDLEINDPSSIWYRKPVSVNYEQLPTAAYNVNYCKSAIEMLRLSLYSLYCNAFWVSDYYEIQRAMHKPAQLNIARKLGFRVPDTVYTNDSDAAKKFIGKYKSCVVKPLSIVRPKNKYGKDMVFLTHQIEDTEAINFSSLFFSPVIFQEQIEAVREIRVTVVGTKVFAAAITSTGVKNSTKIPDYKVVFTQQNAKINIEPYTLSKDISDKCVALVKRLHLQFSAIDILEDKNGTLWFLENNPNGQWDFIEVYAGHQIGKAIAELLTSN